jgi:hypothetical protein
MPGRYQLPEPALDGIHEEDELSDSCHRRQDAPDKSRKIGSLPHAEDLVVCEHHRKDKR